MTPRARALTAAALLAAAALSAAPAAPAFWGGGAPVPAFSLEIRGGRFVPATLTIPSGTKVRLALANRDSAPAEFESFLLHRELIVPAGGTASVFVGPLAAGSYEFFDDFHRAAKGALVAAPAAGAR